VKYAMQTLSRYDTKEERDKAADSLQLNTKKTYPEDDAYIQKHICYHDEDPTKPCEVEEKWEPSMYRL